MASDTRLSENSSKKQGRPTAFDPEIEKLYRAWGFFNPGDTRRTNLNALYRQRAFQVLGLEETPIPEAFSWLVIQRTGKLRETILTELGRIPNDDDLRETATYICTTQPRARDAAVMIRNWRTGGVDREPNVWQLTTELLRAVDDYRTRVPATTLPQVLTALDNARDVVENIAVEADTA